MLYTFDKLEHFNKVKASKDANLLLRTIKDSLSFDKKGKPVETNGYILYLAWKSLSQFPEDIEQELMYQRFYKGSRQRYEAFIKPQMALLHPKEFTMGFHPEETWKYCGEEPLHKVRLSPFYISTITVTQQFYNLYNPFYKIVEGEAMPAVDISWYDAIMFGLWVGCRLPSEAEWEYACRAGSKADWCCKNETEVNEYGWTSENSHGKLHAGAQLKPNAFGLYDMHGNVWEWCEDSYDEDYYARSKKINPVNRKKGINKVCRGGSYHGFTTMCRSALRYNEPAYYYSRDTGFRLAKDYLLY